jgi:hypothetical protein
MKLLMFYMAMLPRAYYNRGMNSILTVRLGKELADALRAESQRSGLAMSEIVRQVLHAHLGLKERPSGRRRRPGAPGVTPGPGANK